MRRLLWTALLVCGSGDVGTALFPHPLVEEVEDVALFNPEKTLRHEGGYANVPGDRGGETWRGVARNFHPEWPGWRIVDALRTRPDFPGCLAADERLKGYVTDFYQNWWEQHGYGNIDHQGVAERVFDISVNAGPKQAHILLQRALRAAAGGRLEEDGVIGPMTLAAVNMAPADSLLAALRSEQAGFYRVLVARNPSQEQFIRGWTERAYSR